MALVGCFIRKKQKIIRKSQQKENQAIWDRFDGQGRRVILLTID